ncbi:uncharacterized protein [Arachis hypogaea]|uniref:uncharacterized protein n=1 Tax=Arachis hypogaea TaxID=3818 RepID=UPI003B22079D
MKQPTFRHCEVFDYFKRKTGVQLSRTNITRSLGDARKIVRSDEAAQYAKLRNYAEELLRSNPGSTVKLSVNAQAEGDPIFQNFYVYFQGCKQGFVHGCRPLIGLDAAFLKTFYGGWLMCIVGGQDANNHIYPIAWAIVPVENTTTWKFNDGSVRDYLDLMNGLIPTLQEVMPNVHHRFCAWHLWHNFQKRWKDKHLKSLLWACVRAQTVSEFNKNMQTLKTINVKAWEYLDKIPRQSWTRAHYKDTPKNDNVCNNMCEIFNSATKPYISKPILILLEEVKRIAMTSMTRNKLKLASHIGHLPPIQQRLPCHHIIAAIACMNGRPENYVHAWLTMGSYNKTYEFHINPVREEEMWDKSEYSHCLPPARPKSHGRPKLYARKKDAHEAPVGGSQERKSKKLKRQYGKFTCGTYGDVGHTTRRCEVAKKLKADEAATAAE